MAGQSGPTSQQPFALFDLGTCSWKTSAQSLELGSLPEPAVTWPKSGMTRAGRAYELPMFEPPTAASGFSSLLPTPQARDGDSRSVPPPATAHLRHNVQGKRNLDDAIALLPTPRASDGEKGGPNQRGSSGDLMLPSAVMLLPASTCGHPDWHHDADGFCTDCPNGCYDGRPDAASDTDGDGCERRQEQDSEPVEPGLEASLRADVDGRVLDWAGYRPAIERWEQALGRRAPAPTVLGKRGGRQLNPVFVEFLMGLPEGWVTAVPGLTRNQMLKCLGNGVVPAQAAAAFRHLWPLLTEQAVAA